MLYKPYNINKPKRSSEHLYAITLVISCIVILYFIYKALQPYVMISTMVGGVVIEHNVTSDRVGSRTYSTLVKTDDGNIVEVTGLQSYTYSIGDRINVEVWRRKHEIN